MTFVPSSPRSLLSFTLGAALLALPATLAKADDDDRDKEIKHADHHDHDRADHHDRDDDKKEEKPKTEFEFSGYGELVFTYFNYGPDERATAKGSKSDSRASLDTRRLSLELEGKLPRDFKFKAEFEVEHGGTGSATEIEYEEAGEYENEIEKGGEAAFEELFLEKDFGSHRVRIGKFPVAVGLLPDHHEPDDYLAAIRAESESQIIPNAWSEIGVDYKYDLGINTFQAQIVNGLDSTGFSSQYFIRQGYQTRFDEVKATNPAFIGRYAIRPVEGLETAVAVYYGDTAQNRPQADAQKKCKTTGPAVNSNATAPCGYERSPVTMYSWNLVGKWEHWQTQASYILGQIEKPEVINDRNSKLSTAYNGILRTPVAKEAYAAWAEVGYGFRGVEEEDRVIPFVRYDRYDSIYKTAPGQADLQRFDRKVITLGADYDFGKSVMFKLDWARRSFAISNFRKEDEVRFNTSFMF